MGRLGPAFLAYQNFEVYLQWNNSLVYSTTAAYLATRIGGAPALRHGTPPPALPFKDVKDMQTLLARAGFDVGKIDGFLGLKTRQAVKAMQVKYGLPADSYPTAELLARMRGRILLRALRSVSPIGFQVDRALRPPQIRVRIPEPGVRFATLLN
jgi:peptidoglycan hydrolase-like protein with peptidoglycan-binding domain